MKNWQKYVAELLGTFVLVFVGSLAILGGGGIIGVGFAFGLALLAGMYAFGEVSGGHFNPIVTLAMFLDRRISAVETIRYWIAQFVGAICASLVILVSYADADRVGLTANTSTSDVRSFVFEIVIAAIFVAVVLQVTKNGKAGGTAFIVIPLTLAALHFATLGLTTTGLNPARSFAPVLLSGNHWSDIWIFLLAPPIGAIVGFIAHLVAVKGDTSFRDDFEAAAAGMRGVDMKDVDIRQGSGQAPPTTPTTPPEAPRS